jgi:hypothetical protein
MTCRGDARLGRDFSEGSLGAAQGLDMIEYAAGGAPSPRLT